MSTPESENSIVETSDSSANPIVDLFFYYLNHCLSLCAQFLGLKPSHFQQSGNQQPEHRPPEFFVEFIEWFAFDDFQVKLLKGFCVVLFCNFLFISLAWSYYGQQISDKLMRPATSRSILELKKSVSQLKLPTEHTPRL